MRYLLAFLLTVIGFAGSSHAQDLSKDDMMLKSLVRQLVDAQISYDAKKLDYLLSSDYVEISPLGEVDPRAKVLSFYTPEQKPPSTMSVSVADEEYLIRNYGKYASVIVRLNYTMTMDGKPAPPRSIRATFLTIKGKYPWKVASAQYTGIRPPQAAK